MSQLFLGSLLDWLSRSSLTAQQNSEVTRVLTSKRGGFVGTESIVRLREESAGGAGSGVAKQARRCAARCAKTEAGVCGGRGRLAECAGPEQTACRTGAD